MVSSCLSTQSCMYSIEPQLFCLRQQHRSKRNAPSQGSLVVDVTPSNLLVRRGPLMQTSPGVGWTVCRAVGKMRCQDARVGCQLRTGK
ncbi:hypothetical protein VZT92_017930 [Zoarces viviparus]|uniref:Uncharacterized protein n=1 Tax=Zoarces viviparus TaxID=48416 RepID=A0AAW1EPG5_ZOAVI